MRRLLPLLVALISALLGWLFAASADAATLTPAHIESGYVYDGHQHTSPATYTATDRGRPADSDTVASVDAVDRWSRGASERPATAPRATAITYDRPTPLVQVARAPATTQDQARRCDGEISSLGSRRVAAKFIGPEAALGFKTFDAAKTAPELASGLERTGSALSKSDAFHRSVSWVVDNPAAQRFAIKGGDGVSRELYQLPGEVNGKSGVFEWVIDRSGTNPVINHQRFIPGGSVTGYPNQVAP